MEHEVGEHKPRMTRSRRKRLGNEKYIDTTRDRKKWGRYVVKASSSVHLTEERTTEDEVCPLSRP